MVAEYQVSDPRYASEVLPPKDDLDLILGGSNILDPSHRDQRCGHLSTTFESNLALSALEARQR
jgi:hypothetical protein